MLSKFVAFVKKMLKRIRDRMTETQTDKSQHQYSNKVNRFISAGRR